MQKIEIGIFAHNEAQNISLLMDDLCKQSILLTRNCYVQLHILANGCSDNTVQVCKEALSNKDQNIKGKFSIHDLEKSGKSRTWNTFVHDLSSNETDFLVFMDADIRIVDPNVLEYMLSDLSRNSSLIVMNSRPVKDLNTTSTPLTFFQKMIIAGSGGLTNYKTSICGMLYAVKASFLRNVYMPNGLPVEDGFLRAMLLTDLLTIPEDLTRISGREDINHQYESIRSLNELFKHQMRIVVGSAINTVIFSDLEAVQKNIGVRSDYLKNASLDELYLTNLLKQNLPSKKYGYVPISFLTKRLSLFVKSNDSEKSFKKGLITFVGVVFDVIVYVLASVKLSRGHGAGYW